MRIIAGELKGREVGLPRGSRARPATGFVRELAMNLFDRAGEPGGHLRGGVFLDLCAGSGLMGLEALSRGARLAVFVETDFRHAGAIRETAQRFGVSERAIVLNLDARRCFPTVGKRLGGQPIDAAFLDPPFIKGMAEDILTRLASAAELFAPEALIIARTPDDMPIALEGLSFLERREAGKSWLWQYQPAVL